MAVCNVNYVANDSGNIHGPVSCVDKSGAIIDLTGATVKLKYRMDGGALQIKTMTVLSPATDGKVQYQFLAGELVVGEMRGEAEITDSGGKIITELCPFTRTIRAKI